MLEDYLKDMAIDAIMQSPIGEKLNKALDIYERVLDNIYALIDKQDEQELTKVKIGTVLTLSILRKLADGVNIKEFTKADWADIANSVSDIAIIMDDQSYSVFVFDMYINYFSLSIDKLKMAGIASESTLMSLSQLVEELQVKKRQLLSKQIDEVHYTEDCLWICLEVTIKLLSAHINIKIPKALQDKGKNSDKNEILLDNEFTEAVAMFAFEYGRYMMYAKEQQILTEYLEHQKQLDAELEQRYSDYQEELRKKSEQFYSLLGDAFNPDFRESFMASIRLARETGVDASEILTTTEEIDDFFM